MATVVSEVAQLHGTPVRVTREDITLLEVDAFVFYASHDLLIGSGYGTAIATRGGSSIQRELKELGPVETCDVVVTGAGNLPAEYIIHAVGPRFKEPNIEDKLRRTMENVLERIGALGLRRVAFPPMGAGYYGIPPALAARVQFETLAAYLAERGLDEVVISVLDTPQHEAFETALAAATGRAS